MGDLAPVERRSFGVRALRRAYVSRLSLRAALPASVPMMLGTCERPLRAQVQRAALSVAARALPSLCFTATVMGPRGPR